MAKSNRSTIFSTFKKFWFGKCFYTWFFLFLKFIIFLSLLRKIACRKFFTYPIILIFDLPWAIQGHHQAIQQLPQSLKHPQRPCWNSVISEFPKLSLRIQILNVRFPFFKKNNRNATVKSTHSKIKIQFVFLGNKGLSAFTSMGMSDVKRPFIRF